MTTVAHQGEDEVYQAYINKDTIVVDPYGNEVKISGINTGKTSGEIQREIATEVRKWDRQAVYVRKQLPANHPEYLQTNMRVGNPKERGYINAPQWDRYDIGFDPAEVADPARRAQAMEIVKDWAQNSELVGREGKRAYTYQDWHLDGASGMPHLRVVVNRVVYDAQNKNLARNSMSISRGGDRNMDLHNLNVRLKNAGFSDLAQVGAKRNGQVINPAVSQSQTLPPDQVIAKADQALTDAGVQPPEPKHDKDFTLLDHGRKDLLNQRYQELLKEVDEKRREMERVQAAMETEEQIAALLNERSEFERKVNDLGVEVEQKTTAINDFAEVVRTDLAERAPEFAERTAELPAEEVVKAGLEKHVEITNTLQAELEVSLAELEKATQGLQEKQAENEAIQAEMDEALAQYFETEELEELKGKSAFEKVDALGDKLTRQVEETAGQLRAKTDEWLNTNRELEETRADRDSKAEELTTAKADIDNAIALLRTDMPELFKNNPDLEKSMRASMEAAITHSKAVAQERDDLASKLRDTEAAKEQLEEQNDSLVQQNKALKSDLEKVQDERDEARKQLEEVTTKLEETTKRVQTLEKVEGNIRNLLKREREEGWQSMSSEEAMETLSRKYDDISRDKNTAVSQVEFYKEQITSLSSKVDKLEERLDEQRRETQEQLAKQQQAHTQQMAELVKGQVNQANQGNVPTQGAGQPKTTPTQGPTGNPPQTKGPSISEE